MALKVKDLLPILKMMSPEDDVRIDVNLSLQPIEHITKDGNTITLWGPDFDPENMDSNERQII